MKPVIGQRWDHDGKHYRFDRTLPYGATLSTQKKKRHLGDTVVGIVCTVLLVLIATGVIL